MTRRVRIGAAAGAAVLLLAGATLAVVLTRDPGGASPPPQTLVTTEGLAKLRTEAEAAARNLFAKIDEADATGNPAVLDGLYTEGAKALKDGQKKAVTNRAAQGYVSVKNSQVSQVQADEVTPVTAVVHLTYQVFRADIRDAKTNKLIERQPGGKPTLFVVRFERINGKWLVARLNIEGNS
jgi:hypothetical protein